MVSANAGRKSLEAGQWMRRYMQDPEQFLREWQTIHDWQGEPNRAGMLREAKGTP
jgi:hypothetical protein